MRGCCHESTPARLMHEQHASHYDASLRSQKCPLLRERRVKHAFYYHHQVATGENEVIARDNGLLWWGGTCPTWWPTSRLSPARPLPFSMTTPHRQCHHRLPIALPSTFPLAQSGEAHPAHLLFAGRWAETSLQLKWLLREPKIACWAAGSPAL